MLWTVALNSAIRESQVADPVRDVDDEREIGERLDEDLLVELETEDPRPRQGSAK